MPRYPIQVSYSEEDGGYIAHLRDHPTLSAFGATEEKAVKELKRATAAWCRALAEEGKTPPRATSLRKHLGGLSIQLPRDLRRKLMVEARRKRLPLTVYCVRK